MPIIILSFFISLSLYSYCITKKPAACYFIYRFSGTICMVILIAFISGIVGLNDKGASIGPIIIAANLYFVWLAKISGFCINYNGDNLMMKILKFYFTAMCVVVFPIGLLAKRMYRVFEIEKIRG